MVVLPDFILPRRVGETGTESGLDSTNTALNRDYFLNYPHQVIYSYNSRGFRDNEWPSNLQKSIWCLGDSFTVGLGSPFAHIWPQVLQDKISRRTINISLDGASNNWISRKAQEVLTKINPEYMIIHWSYIARREEGIDAATRRVWQEFYTAIKDPNWPDCAWEDLNTLPDHIRNEIDSIHGGIPVISDELRRLAYVPGSDELDVANTLSCINRVNQACKETSVVHSFVPNFVPHKLKGHIESQLSGLIIPELTQLDFSRDSHHYDIKTSEYFCDTISQLLT